MLAALGQILDVISFLLNAIEMVIVSLFNLITSIPGYVAFLGGVVLSMPAFITTFVMAGISVTLILFLLGRHS